MFKQISSSIPAFLKFILKTYVLTFGLFQAYRLLFFLVNKPDVILSSEIPLIINAFKMSVLFDNAMFCYITFLPLLFLIINFFLKNTFHFLNKVAYVLYAVFISLYLFVCAADIPYFQQFGNHLSKAALIWSESPAFMAEMVFSNFSYWGFLVVFIFSEVVLFYFLKKNYQSYVNQIDTDTKVKLPYALIVVLVIIGITILGARGRTSAKQVLHEGLAIVSANPFINQIALNPNYTFWKSVTSSKNKNSYQVPKHIDDDLAFTRNYLGIKTPYEKNISRKVKAMDSIHNYNVIIVMMESTSVYKMGYYGGKNLTPNLHELNKQSVFCDNFFSSGIHTFNGLFSVTSGFPSIYTQKSLRSYVKQPFNGLGTVLKNNGYDTYFYTTHDAHFDNMEGFYKLNGYDYFISDADFNSSDVLSNCGVPDHKLFDKLIETHKTTPSTKPFLSVVMTGSDHGPWKIPTDIAYKPNGADEQENCTLYADWAVGEFMKHAKQQPWFKNTVFLFMGDHGKHTNNTYEMPLSYNHVPCIIYQPAILKPDTISSPCTQADIPATVLGLLNVSYTNTSFGINIFKEQHPFVVFSADDKIGCVSNDGYFYYKTLSNNETYLRKYKHLDAMNYAPVLKSKADSMEKNTMKIYESAEYLIREKYFLFD